MKEQLITFETAKLAKEKGFDWSCQSAYTTENKILHARSYNYKEYILDGQVEDYSLFNIETIKNSQIYNTFDEHVLFCLIPTQSLLQKWLRDKHNLEVMVHLRVLHLGWVVKVREMKNVNTLYMNVLNTYEEALEKGLQEALKFII